MKKTLKTKDVVNAYQLIKTARLSGMTLDEKKNVILNTRELKSVSAEFDELQKETRKRLQGDNHDEMERLLVEWQEQERNENVTIEESVRAKVSKYFYNLNHDVNEIMKQEAEKPHDADLHPVNFDKLLACNDWTLEQIILLEDIFC